MQTKKASKKTLQNPATEMFGSISGYRTMPHPPQDRGLSLAFLSSTLLMPVLMTTSLIGVKCVHNWINLFNNSPILSDPQKVQPDNTGIKFM